MECRLGELCIAGIVLILRATFWACSIGGGALSGIDGIVVALQRSFQAAGWLFAGAILVLSLSPPSFRPTTGAANGLEHFMIFLGTGMAFAFGYPRQLRSLLIASPAFAAAIEVVQNWVPGRHARMGDFVVDVVAACWGIGLSRVLMQLRWGRVGEVSRSTVRE